MANRVKRSRARAALLLVGALALGGCAGTPFRWQDADRVRAGMTEAEVIAILGPPYSRSQTGRQTTLVWSYANGLTSRARSVGFTLVDGRVIGNVESGRGGARPQTAAPRSPVER